MSITIVGDHIHENFTIANYRGRTQMQIMTLK